MPTKVITLIENKPALQGSSETEDSILSGEHGLSLLVESHNKKLLFDSGASPLIAQNVDSLRMGNSIAGLDAIVLSHGHYDHTGGLAEILKRCKSEIPVHVRPGFFHRKILKRGNKLKDIGVPYNRVELEHLGAHISEGLEQRQILPDFFLTGKIERQPRFSISN